MKKRLLFLVSALGLLTLFTTACAGPAAPVMPEIEIPTPVNFPAPTPEATPAGDPVRGETLFAGKCAACHGQGAGGGYGPPLSGVGPESVETAVRQGKGRMPALGSGAVQDRDLEDIVAYLLSLAAN